MAEQDSTVQVYVWNESSSMWVARSPRLDSGAKLGDIILKAGAQRALEVYGDAFARGHSFMVEANGVMQEFVIEHRAPMAVPACG